MPSSESTIRQSLFSSTTLITAALRAPNRAVSEDALPPSREDTQEFIARTLQSARGPRGRHLSRFEPARIVLQGLGLQKLTEVTSQGFPASHDCGSRQSARPQ